MAGNSDCIYIGLDFSTQQIKATVINNGLEVVYENAVKFDTDLPEFNITGGANIAADNITVTAPTIMWVKALDLLLEKMKADNFDFSKVAGISGAAQQHGSIFWKQGMREKLQNLKGDQPLAEQLKDGFSVSDSPIWMDSSTTQQCRDLEEKLGGPQAVADLTGSRAYERFTGNQIAKIYQTQPLHYAATKRISLVSSFAASLFLGDYAAIDDGDGSGMNLMNLRSRTWDQACLEACAPGLEEKLGPIVHSATNLGKVSQYYVDRYSMNSDCGIIAFTGDNPSSVAGMRMQRGDVVLSLGTSDNVFLWIDEPKPSIQGHIFANPTDRSAYMSLLCYKNGSLTREKICNEKAEGSWQKFSEYLEATAIGNEDCLGMYYFIQEITPHLVGEHRFCGHNKPQTFFHEGTEVRAVIEGQFIAKRVHAEALGYKIGPETRLLATGGASINQSILQVASDVFNAPVYVQDIPNSASLGGAYRAKHAVQQASTSFQSVIQDAPPLQCVARPNTQAAKVYTPLVARFKELEKKLIETSQAA